MADYHHTRFTADDESDSIGISILYPILGSLFIIVCVISIAAFILSNRRCRKNSPNNTESEILKNNLSKDKEKIAQSNLVYTMNGKPVYTSITQQEDNEIAEEVRETYKAIAMYDNKPIECCPDQAGYLYHPVQSTELPSIQKPYSKSNMEDIVKKERDAEHQPGVVKPPIPTANSRAIPKDHKSIELLPSSLKKSTCSIYQQREKLFDSLEKRSTGCFHYSTSELSSPETRKELLTSEHPQKQNPKKRNKKHQLQLNEVTKAYHHDDGNAKDSLLSKWITQEGNGDTQGNKQYTAESDIKGDSSDYVKESDVKMNDVSVVNDFESSCKTNMDLDFEDVESILTSVSRMDTRRIRKLQETSFYQNLQHSNINNNGNKTKLSDYNQIDSPQFTDSIDSESLDDSLDTLSHEEILTLELCPSVSEADCDDISANLQHISDNWDLTKVNGQNYSDNMNDVSDSDNERKFYPKGHEKEGFNLTTLRDGISNKHGFKKPVQYIDRDSESFFKIVRPVLNPDELSESSRTQTENFKKSKGDQELTESLLSNITYSYDKHSHFVIIDEQGDKRDKSVAQPYSLRPRIYSTSSTSTTLSQATSNKSFGSIAYSPDSPTSVTSRFETIANNSRPVTLDLEQRNNDLSIDMSTSYDSQQFSTEGSSSTGNTARRHSQSRSQCSTHSSSTHQSSDSKSISPRTNKPQRYNNAFDYSGTEYSDSEDNTETDNSSKSKSSTTSATSASELATQQRSKYRSLRGNLSAYVTSRQCATSTKAGINGKIQTRKEGKHFKNIGIPKRVNKSPGTRMFHRSPKKNTECSDE